MSEYVWIISIAHAAGMASAAASGIGRRHGFGRRQRQHRPEPFAAREQAVAHRVAR